MVAVPHYTLKVTASGSYVFTSFIPLISNDNSIGKTIVELQGSLVRLLVARGGSVVFVFVWFF